MNLAINAEISAKNISQKSFEWLLTEIKREMEQRYAGWELQIDTRTGTIWSQPEEAGEAQ